MTNNEWAILIWAFIAFVFVFFKAPRFWPAVLRLIKCLLKPKICITILAFIIYFTLITSILCKIGIWNSSFIISSIVWVAFIGFPFLVKSNDIDNIDFFNSLILRSFKFAILIDFFLSERDLSIIAEFIIVPFSFFLGLIIAVSSSESKFESVHKLMNAIASLFVFILLLFGVFQFISDFSTDQLLRSLIKIVLPILYTLALIPFLYINSYNDL